MEAEKDRKVMSIEEEAQAVVKTAMKAVAAVEMLEELEYMAEKEVKGESQKVEVKVEKVVKVEWEKEVEAEEVDKKMDKGEMIKSDPEVAALTCQGLTNMMEGCTRSSWSW